MNQNLDASVEALKATFEGLLHGGDCHFRNTLVNDLASVQFLLDGGYRTFVRGFATFRAEPHPHFSGMNLAEVDLHLVEVGQAGRLDEVVSHMHAFNTRLSEKEQEEPPPIQQVRSNEQTVFSSLGSPPRGNNLRAMVQPIDDATVSLGQLRENIDVLLSHQPSEIASDEAYAIGVDEDRNTAASSNAAVATSNASSEDNPPPR